jgi:hypothetical protein
MPWRHTVTIPLSLEERLLGPLRTRLAGRRAVGTAPSLLFDCLWAIRRPHWSDLCLRGFSLEMDHIRGFGLLVLSPRRTMRRTTREAKPSGGCLVMSIKRPRPLGPSTEEQGEAMLHPPRSGGAGYLDPPKWPFFLRKRHNRPPIAHLAETPFGFSTSTLLPITPQTPKHLGFGVIMPFRVRRYTPFGLKTPASWRNGFFDSELFDLRYPANGFFNF